MMRLYVLAALAFAGTLYAGCLEDFPPDGCDPSAAVHVQPRTGKKKIDACYCPYSTPLMDNVDVDESHECLDQVGCLVTPGEYTFANLSTPTPVTGEQRTCSDCIVSNPAAGGGTNTHIACRYNGSTWACWRPPLTLTSTIDFASASTNTCSTDISKTVTGAAVGDVVTLGIPNGSVNTGSIFYAWVSATDTVKVRHCNLSGSSNDPASGSFTIHVWH